MLELINLNVFYGSTPVLDQINLKVDSNEICTMIGPSGCGKSTLLGAVAGLNPNYQGDILLNGERVSPKKHTIGLIPQNFGLLPWKTVHQNIVLGLEIRGRRRLDALMLRQIDSILERLKILAFKNRYPRELSGGQKQRVAIARAFVLEADLLLMDEPFSALDALTREATVELFLDLWKEKKIATLFVTHDLSEAMFVGTKLVLLSPAPGKIVKVLEDPSLELTAEMKALMKEEWK